MTDEQQISEQVFKALSVFVNSADTVRTEQADLAIADALIGLLAEFRELRFGRDDWLESQGADVPRHPGPQYGPGPGDVIGSSTSIYGGRTFSTS